tara:strand:+ start:379 stop:666 length:288 start_codon:yes stop_codon:yes gene_type:complete
MAQFCIDIADEDVERVINALCSTYGRSEMVENPDFDPSEEEGPDNPREIPNPETPNEFANRMVRKFIKEVTVAHAIKKEKEHLPSPTPPNISPAA